MPSKPNKLFPTREAALTTHKMAMKGNDTIYEARFWRNFHEEFPDVSPGAVQSVLENNWDELENAPTDQAIDRLVTLAGGRRPHRGPIANAEEWRQAREARERANEPPSLSSIINKRAAQKREWQEANADKIAERRRAEAPLDQAKKELARLQREASTKEDAA